MLEASVRRIEAMLPADAVVLDVGGWASPLERADWVVDLGPEGGEAGGEVVAVGTPEEVAEVEDSYTGRFLREVLPKVAAAA